jgi:lipoprotein signal peptidase
MNLCLFSEAKFMFFLRIISIAITVYFFKQAKIKYKKNKNIFPEATIIAGAIGNLIDRFYYGYVIDFIFFNFPFTQYIAIANIADVAITIGCAWLMLKMIIHDVLRKKEKSNSKKKSFRHPMRNTNYEIE